MNNGWIKLHRKIRENPIFNDHKLFRLWIICLTEATHKEREQIVGRQIVKLLPGEFVTGRFELRDSYNKGLPNGEKVKGEKTVFRWLELLEKGSYLTIKKTTKYSVVSISNWLDYQSPDQQMTNKRPTNDQQMTTNKNVKNVKNDKEEVIKDIVPLPFEEIVTYLNEMAKTNYRHSGKKTQTLIKARIKEGFKLEDFQKVIDTKSSQWLGDPKMETYLRPETLFGTKFESYLNEKGGSTNGVNRIRDQQPTKYQDGLNF